MKAVVLHEYGSADKLRFEDWDDPVAGPGEVLVRVSAASINPIDWKVRSGHMQAMFPLSLPAILGRDVSGIVREVGEGVEGFEPGDRVFALADHTYAELCVVKSEDLAHLPDGINVAEAAAVPLIAVTGEQLIRVGTQIAEGETVLIAGAVGSVGRVAIWTAKQAGAKVIAGVRKHQLDEAAKLGADQTIALDDEQALAKLGFVDAVADAVGGETATKLLAKVKQGGVFATVLEPPKGLELHPTLRFKHVDAQPDPVGIVKVAEAVAAGKLLLPIDRILPLSEAAEAHHAGEKGGIGKILLTA